MSESNLGKALEEATTLKEEITNLTKENTKEITNLTKEIPKKPTKRLE